MADPLGAACLIDPKALAYLAPFTGRERTASEVAAELGVTLPRLHYQLTRLLGAGLIQVVREVPRAGRALKVYGAAPAFFVPFEATDHETLEAAISRATRAWQQRFVRSVVYSVLEIPGRWGLRVFRDETGVLVLEPGHAPDRPWDLLADDSPAVLPGGWATDLQLDFEDAKALQRELAAIGRKYLGRGGSQRYLLQLNLAPLHEEGKAASG